MQLKSRPLKARCFTLIGGFTLIEVLIAILILSISLLGMAGLQVLSLQASSSSLSRSQATMIAYDLAERMRRNSSAARDGAYNIIAPSLKGDDIHSPDCIEKAPGCNPKELADQDIREWFNHLQDVPGIGMSGDEWQPALLDALATLTQDKNQFTLLLQWSDNHFASSSGSSSGTDGDNPKSLFSYQMVFEL